MRMIRIIQVSLVFASLAAAPSLEAQSPEEQVLAVIDRLMTSMREADSATAAAVFHPQARLVTVDSRDGHHQVRAIAVESFVAGIGGSGRNWNERVWDPEISFDGDLALVWAKYDFLADGHFSHCGVDAFHLARTPQGWRIISIIYTRRTEGCESPPGG